VRVAFAGTCREHARARLGAGSAVAARARRADRASVHEARIRPLFSHSPRSTDRSSPSVTCAGTREVGNRAGASAKVHSRRRRKRAFLPPACGDATGRDAASIRRRDPVGRSVHPSLVTSHRPSALRRRPHARTPRFRPRDGNPVFRDRIGTKPLPLRLRRLATQQAALKLCEFGPVMAPVRQAPIKGNDRLVLAVLLRLSR
jgi:hypothetical protein